MHLAKETNRSLLRLRKRNIEIAIPKVIDKRTINDVRYLVLIVLFSSSMLKFQILQPKKQNQYNTQATKSTPREMLTYNNRQ